MPASLGGFIVYPDGCLGGFEWNNEVVADLFAKIGTFCTVPMGRKTYEVGIKEGKISLACPQNQLQRLWKLEAETWKEKTGPLETQPGPGHFRRRRYLRLSAASQPRPPASCPRSTAPGPGPLR